MPFFASNSRLIHERMNWVLNRFIEELKKYGMGRFING